MPVNHAENLRRNLFHRPIRIDRDQPPLRPVVIRDPPVCGSKPANRYGNDSSRSSLRITSLDPAKIAQSVDQDG